MQERTALEDQLTAIGRIERELDDQVTMIELGEAEKDQRVIAEAEDALKRLKAEAARRELEALLSGEADANDAYLEVHAGAGGTESQDWAEMLMRMYMRWAEQHGYKVEWLEESDGEGAGIKSATIRSRATTPTAGSRPRTACIAWCAFRRSIPMRGGTPRLPACRSIRWSTTASRSRSTKPTCAPTRCAQAAPAASTSTRPNPRCASPTSRPASRWCASRSVRSTRTALRPGTCCARGSMNIELKRREEQAAAEQAAKTDIGWGHQIRSYVLQPYQMVKDLRTGVTSPTPSDVLDGDLDPFMAAVLAQKAFGEGPKEVADVE